MPDSSDDRVYVSYKKAAAMLPGTEEIHTFRQGPPANLLVGAHWSRKQILKALKQHVVQLSGPAATASGHGLVFEDEHGYVFVETKKGAL
jgi:hypothetical protein